MHRRLPAPDVRVDSAERLTRRRHLADGLRDSLWIWDGAPLACARVMRVYFCAAVLAFTACGGKQEALLFDTADAASDATAPTPTPSGHPNPAPHPPEHDAGSGVGTLTCPYESLGAAGTKITYDRSCRSVADCAMATHERDCCGAIIVLGINKRETDRFITDTGICHNGGPACDCLAAGPIAEDGVTAPSSQVVVVDCVLGVCRTRVAR